MEHTRDDLDRRPSIIVDAGEAQAAVLSAGIAKKRGRRGSVSAEAYRPDESFKLPQHKHPEQEIHRLFQSTRNNILIMSLAETQKRKLFAAMERKEVSRGEVLIEEGGEGDYFYVVQRGTFDVYKADSGATPVFTYNAGGSFGELALMYNCPRAATVQARSDGVVYKMERHTFKQ